VFPAVFELPLLVFDCRTALHLQFRHHYYPLALEAEFSPEGSIVEFFLFLQVADDDLLVVGALPVYVGTYAFGAEETLSLTLLDKFLTNRTCVRVFQLHLLPEQTIQVFHLVNPPLVLIPRLCYQLSLAQTSTAQPRVGLGRHSAAQQSFLVEVLLFQLGRQSLSVVYYVWTEVALEDLLHDGQVDPQNFGALGSTDPCVVIGPVSCDLVDPADFLPGKNAEGLGLALLAGLGRDLSFHNDQQVGGEVALSEEHMPADVPLPR
jgi:hypothetical protein